MITETASIAAQPVAEDDGPLSPWWIRAVVIVMILGFAGLILITTLSYQNAPPIPARVVSQQGATLFTADDVGDGQAVFLHYGLMANGSIWGHGAYLGPDYSASALHRMGIVTAEGISQAQHQKAFAALNRSEAAAVQAETAVALKTNHYDESSDTLHFTNAQVTAFNEEIGHWTAYFQDSSRNGGLKVNLITDPTELRQFTAFVTWAAWASVAARPGEAHSYTNTFLMIQASAMCPFQVRCYGARSASWFCSRAFRSCCWPSASSITWVGSPEVTTSSPRCCPGVPVRGRTRS